MKQIFAISFLLIYFLALLNPITPYISYSFNKTEIIEKFCENKDKPALQCEGKCHLKKQLTKKAEEDGDKDENIKTNASCSAGSINPLTLKSISKFGYIITIPSRNTFFNNDLFSKIDRPPQIV